VDRPVSRLVQPILVFNSMHLGPSALWAIEGPPFQATDYALQRAIALLCEGLEARKP
jgi:hypothetical protein